MLTRQECPECGHKHELTTATDLRTFSDISTCPLYSPVRSIADENKLFGDFWVHINQEIDRMQEERYFEEN
jgi:hypothetical protein